MSDDRIQRKSVTDTEIEDIIAQGEAGINDLIAAYEPIERSYFKAVHLDVPVVSSTSTLAER